MSDSTLATFLVAFGLSLTYCLVPGPIDIAALQRGTRRGGRAVLAVRLGSLTGSLAWAAAGFTGVAVAAQHPPVQMLLGVAGTAILLLLAAQALRTVQAATQDGEQAGARHGDVLAGLLLTLADPLEAVFWLGVSGVVLDGVMVSERIAETTAFLGGFIAADLLSAAAFAALVGWGRCVSGGRFARLANLCCVATLVLFALGPLLHAVA